MNKILLVFEEYADLMEIESSLKRVGFDVLGISSEYSLSEQILAFNPDVVVGSGRGGKVTSVGVGKRLKEMPRWQGKAILIFPSNSKPSPQDLIKIRVDMVLESPVAPMRLIQVLAKLLGHDEALLLERLNKAIHVENKGKTATTSGSKLSPDEEAFFVKGSSDQEGGSASVGEFKLDKSSEESGEGGDESLSQRRIEFRLGERMTAAEPERISSDSLGDSVFPDVDLKALERELLGGGTPEIERVPETENVPVAETTPVISEDPRMAGESKYDDPEQQQLRREELRLANEKLVAKAFRYAEFAADVKLSPKSTMTRVETRKRQRQLMAEVDREKVKDIDELRREFTKALFKK